MNEPLPNPDNGWWDGPRPNPRQRRPMEELLLELAERTGRPVWPVVRVVPSSQGAAMARGRAA